jgi:hypothetical protein
LLLAAAGGLLDLLTTSAILVRNPGDELNLVLQTVAGGSVPGAIVLFGAFVTVLVTVAALDTPWLSRIGTLYLFVIGLSGLNNVLFLTAGFSPLYATMGEASSLTIAYGVPISVLLCGTGWSLVAETELRWHRVAVVSAACVGAIAVLPALAT